MVLPILVRHTAHEIAYSITNNLIINWLVTAYYYYYYFAFARWAKYCYQCVCVSVCLSVCLSFCPLAYLKKPHVHISTNFLYSAC